VKIAYMNEGTSNLTVADGSLLSLHNSSFSCALFEVVPMQASNNPGTAPIPEPCADPSGQI
jgi:hypothetical protein